MDLSNTVYFLSLCSRGSLQLNRKAIINSSKGLNKSTKSSKKIRNINSKIYTRKETYKKADSVRAYLAPQQ